MISWLFNKKSCTKDECIEEVFFKTILVICVLGCTVAVFFEVLVTSRFGYNAWLGFLLIQVSVVGLYAMRKILFRYVTVGILLVMDILLTYRGILVEEYVHVTCALLIAVGFVCSLITKGGSRQFLRMLVLASLLLMLFKNYQEVPSLILIRHAIPYLIVYFIVTISSGILKDRYEQYQKRLVELVELLNQKNAKINDQHKALQKSHDQLANLNQSLERTVRIKTSHIQQKNEQLGEIAYANAHRVRGPLARILGLLHLMEIDPMKKDCYLSWVSSEAKQLDEITKVLGRDIEENIGDRHEDFNPLSS